MRAALVTVLLTLSAVACSSETTSSPQSDAATTADSAVGCTNDPRADVWAVNTPRTGATAKLQFTFVSAEPAPPMRGINKWVVRVTDPTGAVIAGATVEAEPFMPDHGHGSPAPPVVAANTDGTYTIRDLDLFMPGLWIVTIKATKDGVSDSLAVGICIAG